MHSVDTTAAIPALDDAPLVVGGITLASRLVVGTGKYATYAEMARCLDVSGTDCVTVAVRRERLINAAGENILDHLDAARYSLLPNTAGCYSADDAVRVARLGRELLRDMGSATSEWVKLEVPISTCLPTMLRLSLSEQQMDVRFWVCGSHRTNWWASGSHHYATSLAMPSLRLRFHHSLRKITVCLLNNATKTAFNAYFRSSVKN